MLDYDEFLTTEEAARMLKMKPQSLRKRRGLGLPPRFVKIGGRAVRYMKAEILAWTEASTFRSTAEATEAGRRGAA